MPQIPCVMVAAGQAVGGIAGQWIGPEIYGGGQDWKHRTARVLPSVCWSIGWL
jgi:hypothetical protein